MARLSWHGICAVAIVLSLSALSRSARAQTGTLVFRSRTITIGNNVTVGASLCQITIDLQGRTQPEELFECASPSPNPFVDCEPGQTFFFPEDAPGFICPPRTAPVGSRCVGSIDRSEVLGWRTFATVDLSRP